MRTIVLCAVALVAFSWCPMSSAQELTQVFASTEGFTIKLPQGWGRIDKSTLQASAEELTEALPNSQQLKAKTKQIIDGFQPEPTQSGVGYPRILVIVDRVGRVSDDDLRQVVHSAQVVQGKADSTMKGNSWNASTKVDEMIYDESGHFLRMSHNTSVPGRGSLYGLNIMFAADFGMLTFQFTSKQEDYESYSPVFAQIIRSIHVEHSSGDSGSQPSAGTDGARQGASETRWEDILAKSVVGAAVVSLLMWQQSRRKRAKADKPPDAPSVPGSDPGL